METKEFQGLVDCLAEQKVLYLHIVDVLTSEKNFLILADIKALIENNKLKESLLSKSRALEKIRQVRFEALLKSLKLEGKATSISELIPLLAKEQAIQIIEVQGELTKTLHSVREANRQNEKLVANAKNVIDAGLKSLKGDTPDSQTYKKQGKIEPGKIPGKIVSREV